MMNDRNKTQLTKDVTSAAIMYLDERGCKPIETEVWVCREPCWIADVAGVLNPTQTELIMLRLIKNRPKWTTPQHDIWREQLISLSRLMAVIVEVKTSRSDFRGDKKWKRPIPADLAYLAIPRGISSLDEWPDGWGILEYHEGVLRCLRAPTPRVSTIEERLHVTLQVAMRRDNHSRYERMRSFQREERQYRNEEVSRTRISSAMRAMISIVKGEHGSVTEALNCYGIKNIPAGVIEELEMLWRVRLADSGCEKQMV